MALVSRRTRSSNYQTLALNRFLVIFSFLGIPLGLYMVWVLWPTLYTFYLSLTNWDSFTPPVFVGFQNYQYLIADPEFQHAVINNALWILVFITVPTAAGLALATVLNNNLRFDRFLKVAYFLPMVIAPVIIALIWSWIYLPEQGLLNAFINQVLKLLQAIGFNVDPKSAYSIGWLGDPKLALVAVMAPAVWRQTGYVMILYLAGLKTVDAEVVEAAKVDGATGWTMFRYVIFPMLSPVTTIVVVVSIIDSLRSFDIVNVMTKGGPVSATEVLANYMYVKSFDDNRLGYGAAIAVVLFGFALIFVMMYLRQVMAQEDEGTA
jgi:ABC-type sugar transport system permease subunit